MAQSFRHESERRGVPVHGEGGGGGRAVGGGDDVCYCLGDAGAFEVFDDDVAADVDEG